MVCALRVRRCTVAMHDWLSFCSFAGQVRIYKDFVAGFVVRAARDADVCTVPSFD